MAALATITLAVGCGSSPTHHVTTSVAKPTSTSVAFTEGQILAVHLGTPLPVALHKLGPSPYRAYRVGGLYCLYYHMAESERGLWRLCFRRGKLSVVSTYIK
jgi:hypothetical protein